MIRLGGKDVNPLQRMIFAYAADQAVVSMMFVVLAWAAAQQGSVSGTVGVMGVMSVTKIVVLLGAGGAVGKRFGRSAVLIRTIDIRLVLLPLLVGAVHLESPMWLLVWAGIYGLVDGFHEPTFQALSVDVASRDRQTSTQGWMDTLKRSCTVGGYPLAGAIISATGTTTWTVVAAGVLLIISRMILPRVAAGPQPASVSLRELLGMIVSDALVGWRRLWRIRPLRAKLSLFTVANLALTPPIVAGIPLLAVEHGWASWQFGLVTAAYWFGSIGGGITMGRWGDRFDSRKVEVALVTLLPTALGTAAFGWFGQAWSLAAGILLITGLFSGMGPTLLTASMKSDSPGDIITQIMSARSLAIMAGAPVGYVLLGAAPSVTTAVVALGLGLAAVCALLLAVRPSSLVRAQPV